MTPFLAPATPAEERFNESLMRTRVLIEQTFGILKRRFQVLHHEIRAKPSRAVTYTVSSVILHNIGIDRGDIIDIIDVEDDDDDAQGRDAVIPAGVAGGDGVRRHIVDTFFSA